MGPPVQGPVASEEYQATRGLEATAAAAGLIIEQVPQTGSHSENLPHSRRQDPGTGLLSLGSLDSISDKENTQGTHKHRRQNQKHVFGTKLENH